MKRLKKADFFNDDSKKMTCPVRFPAKETSSGKKDTW